MEVRSASRIIGVLVLAQMVCGAPLNFVLLAPLFAPGFLVIAKGFRSQANPSNERSDV